MTIATENSLESRKSSPAVRPSRVDPRTTAPFTIDQELEKFGAWVGEPIWVPPKDCSQQLAASMQRSCRFFASQRTCWASVIEHHRDNFTQVREIEMARASIRLPQGKLFVTVTDRQHFDKITDEIPACVQTRLDEFLQGPGNRRGVKVYYLKPLCVEVDDQLIFTSRMDLMAAIEQIQAEVFAEYRRLRMRQLPVDAIGHMVGAVLSGPRLVFQLARQRQQRALDAYHAKLEFQRRKTALRAARTHQRFRTDGCTFDEMLALTNPLERTDVIEQFSVAQQLSNAKRNQLLRLAAGHVPWFMALSIGLSQLATLALTFTPPVMVCDPAFVAEFPDANGELLKIGHFDDVGGVRHIEL